MPKRSLYQLFLKEIKRLNYKHQPGKKPLPKRVRRKITGRGLTARQMIAATPNNIKRNSRHVRVRRIRYRQGTPLSLAITTTEKNHATEPQPHYQSVQVIGSQIDRDIFAPRTRLKISCDCSHFKYRCEYSLSTYGAADIIYSNGFPANQTNPFNTPWLCKHWISIFRFLHNYTNDPNRRK